MGDLTSERLSALADGDAMNSKERDALIAMARRGHAEADRDFRRGVRQGISIARRFARIITSFSRPPRLEWCDAITEAKRIGVDDVADYDVALAAGRAVLGWRARVAADHGSLLTLEDLAINARRRCLLAHEEAEVADLLERLVTELGKRGDHG